MDNQKEEDQMPHLGQAREMNGPTQIIDFASIHEETSCVVVTSDDVEIHPSSGDHITGSSKVRMNNVVDYSWEEKYYDGQLIAVHMTGKYIAYSIKAPNNPQWSVRVINRETGLRSLIKGMEGTIEDLSFAHIHSLVLLAILDRTGTLVVYHVTEEESGIQCKLYVHIDCVTDYETDPKALMRIYWCPYVPDAYDKESENDGSNLNLSSPAHQIAVTWGHRVDVWHVSMLNLLQGVGPHSHLNSSNGCLQIKASLQTVTDAALSPDGTAIAVSSEDGKCKFYQVYLPGVSPMRCLHEWEPHDAYPVTSLFFLDDYINIKSDVRFWKYALTGAKNGTEFKFWSCETWNCLQKITLSLGPLKSLKSNRLLSSNSWKIKVAVDNASNYVFLSDMYSRLLTVLKLGKKNGETLPRVTSVTEFKMPCPILSFGVAQAGPRTFKLNSVFNYEDVCNDESEKDSLTTNVIDLYLVQPKSLQQCHITFKTTDVLIEPTSCQSECSESSSDVQIIEDEKNSSRQDSESSSVPPVVGSESVDVEGPILMTPDAFNSLAVSSTARDLSDLSVDLVGQLPSPTPLAPTSRQSSPIVDPTTTPLLANLPTPPAVSSLSILPVPEPPVVPVVDSVSLSNAGAALSGGFVSGGSSPSREVEEILAMPMFLDESPSKTKQNVSIQGFHSDTHTLLSLKAEVEALSHLVLQLATDIKVIRRELETSEKRLSDKIETNVTRALTEDQGSSGKPRIRCLADLTPIQTALGDIREDLTRNLSVSLRTTESLKEDIKPVIQQSLDQIKTAVQSELSRKLSDQAVKDNLNKALKSKPVLDSITGQLSAAAITVMNQAVDQFVRTGVPLFEKATASMLQQINRQFSAGLIEYKKELDAIALKYNERSNLELAAMQAATEHICRSSEKMNSSVEKEIKRLDDVTIELNRSVSKILETASSSSLNNGSVRSRTVTPACPVNDLQVVQMQVSQLLKQGRYNEAFQQALSVSDLTTVIIACEKASPEKVFKMDGNVCPLQQYVLLSLIQQLSNELNTFTSLKLTYIEGAILCLDHSQLSVQEHIPTVITALQKQLQIYISSKPPVVALEHKAKMILMVVNHLLERKTGFYTL